MIVSLGIDPSLNSTGYAVVGGGVVLYAGTLPPAKGAKGWDRMYATASKIADMVFGHRPEVITMEGPAFAAKGGAGHELAGAWWSYFGAIRQTIPKNSLFATPGPPMVKKFLTGSGVADKDKMLAHAIRHATCSPGVVIEQNDVADAVALAYLGAYWRGYPSLPKTAYRDEVIAKMVAR